MTHSPVWPLDLAKFLTRVTPWLRVADFVLVRGLATAIWVLTAITSWMGNEAHWMALFMLTSGAMFSAASVLLPLINMDRLIGWLRKHGVSA